MVYQFDRDGSAGCRICGGWRVRKIFQMFKLRLEMYGVKQRIKMLNTHVYLIVHVVKYRTGLVEVFRVTLLIELKPWSSALSSAAAHMRHSRQGKDSIFISTSLQDSRMGIYKKG